MASTIKGNISAWKIECDRLQKKKLGKYPWHNTVIRGQLMSVVLVACAYAMGGLAAIPPLWHKLMTPKVLEWDRDYATAEELDLAAQANRDSGIPTLVQRRALSA